MAPEKVPEMLLFIAFTVDPVLPVRPSMGVVQAESEYREMEASQVPVASEATVVPAEPSAFGAVSPPVDHLNAAACVIPAIATTANAIISFFIIVFSFVLCIPHFAVHKILLVVIGENCAKGKRHLVAAGEQSEQTLSSGKLCVIYTCAANIISVPPTSPT